jgi:hypothetical protein
MELKDIIAIVDRRTLGLASIVVAVFIIIAALVGFFTRDTLLDFLINDVYHVSANIEKRVAADMPVGYGRTFIFDEYNGDSLDKEVPQTLLFALAPSQSSRILLSSNVPKKDSPNAIPIIVTVDGQDRGIFPAGTKFTVPFPNGNKPIFESMNNNNITSIEQFPGHAHALSVSLGPHKGYAFVTVDALVEVAGAVPSGDAGP